MDMSTKKYEFKEIEVKIVDLDNFKGLVIYWTASKIGFGQVWLGWGASTPERKLPFHQEGFYTTTEFMSDKFVEALIKDAAPQITKIIMEYDRDK